MVVGYSQGWSLWKRALSWGRGQARAQLRKWTRQGKDRMPATCLLGHAFLLQKRARYVLTSCLKKTFMVYDV